jgi:hypothetical protein
MLTSYPSVNPTGCLRNRYSQNRQGYYTGKAQIDKLALMTYPVSAHAARQRDLAQRAARRSHKAAAPLIVADVLNQVQTALSVSPTQESPMPAKPDQIVQMSRRNPDIDVIWKNARASLIRFYDRQKHFTAITGLTLAHYDPSHQRFHLDSPTSLPAEVEREIIATLKAICGFAVTVHINVIGQQSHYERIAGATPL